MTAPILVTGGTGNIGADLVRLLVAAGQPARVLTRDAAKAKGVLGATVELVEGDLTKPETLGPAFAGVERAFLLSGAGPQLAPTGGAFARAAKAAGVRHLVVVSSGTIEMSPRGALGAWHLALEEAVTAAGIAATFLRPDNFASNALRWAGTIRGKGMVFAAMADSQSVPIDPRDIAAVAHVALTHPGHEGKTYTLSGPSVMTTRAQVAAIAGELGRELRVVDATLDQAREGMLRGGLPPHMADAILEVYGHPPRPTTTVRDVTGREPRTFAAWVKDHRAAFA